MRNTLLILLHHAATWGVMLAAVSDLSGLATTAQVLLWIYLACLLIAGSCAWGLSLWRVTPNDKSDEALRRSIQPWRIGLGSLNAGLQGWLLWYCGFPAAATALWFTTTLLFSGALMVNRAYATR